MEKDMLHRPGEVFGTVAAPAGLKHGKSAAPDGGHFAEVRCE